MSNGGLPITGYHVRPGHGRGGTAGSAFRSPSNRSVTLTGLTNGTVYRFNVTAINQLGSSFPGR